MTDLDPNRQNAIDPASLYGRTCPSCGVDIDPGSVRWNGLAWEHKNPEAHPQAGHHIFDALDAVRGPETWRPKAEQNIDTWGQQDVVTLFLAAVEELGEIAIELDDQRGYLNGANTDEAIASDLLTQTKRLGIETRDFLEDRADRPGDPDDLIILNIDDTDVIQAEVDDLAALLYQLTWKLDGGDTDG